MKDARYEALERVNCILFDLDGTLADTIELIVFSFRETLRVLGLPPRSDEEIIAEIGRPLYQQALDIYPERAQEIFSTYQRLYDEHHDRLVREFPGVREALSALAERGYRLGVVTSKRSASAAPDLRYFRLETFFEILVTADDTERHKPDPEPLLFALHRLGVERERATYIGDSPFDLRAAHAAGVPAGAVAWGPFSREVLQSEEPDYWVGEPADLLTLFPGV